jgi:hypothetical protein
MRYPETQQKTQTMDVLKSCDVKARGGYPKSMVQTGIARDKCPRVERLRMRKSHSNPKWQRDWKSGQYRGQKCGPKMVPAVWVGDVAESRTVTKWIPPTFISLGP